MNFSDRNVLKKVVTLQPFPKHFCALSVFIALLCIGENRFRVTKSLNGRLLVGDEVTIRHFRIDYPMEVSHIVRNGTVMCDDGNAELCYIAGKKNGITHLIIHD